MPRKPKVQRTPEEKWQIVLEGLKSGNVAETCRKYEIAPTLYYRWKDEVEEGAKAALGGRSAAARPDVEQEKRIKQLERALGRSHLQIEILKTCWASELRASAFVGTGVSSPRQRNQVSGRDSGDQPVQSLLSTATARQSCGSFAR